MSAGSWTGDAADALLEATVAGSFTRVGCAVRRRLDAWAPLPADALAGRVVVITGASSGLGLAAARRVALLGGHVVGIAREGPRAAEAFAQLGAEVGTARVELVSADLGDLAAVRRAAAAIAARHGAVHALAHNAGALDDAFRASASGVEQTVASQVVGPFLLTQLLRPQLRAAAPSRVVWVSSGGMYAEALDVAKLAMTASSYDGVSAYARAKRAQITLSELLAERLRHDGVVVHAMHPGWADTPGVARSLPTFRALVGPLLRTPDEGAETLVWLLAGVGAPLDRTGLFWLDRRPRPTHKLARTRRADTPEERAKLWAWVVRESGWEGEA